ncbi:MAG TPA: CsgG/HfaB family protein [Kiritimatiellia bacterium]|nr:CsgG/HfaB family protein [Kiritimatiellia bacterium]HMP35114.1 CsgG/HfaB family protein [Kiritimatiellia bacterium]
MKSVTLIATGLLCAVSLTGCQTLGQFTGNTPTERTNADMGLGEYKGLKHAVGVKGFENEAGWRGQWELGDNLAAMLESALFDTGRFVLVEREKLTDVIAEQDLAASGRTAKAAKVARTGVIRSARYIATGTITTVEEAASGGGGGVSVGGFRVGLGGSKAQITIIAKLIDTSTGEIVAKERITGKPGGIGASIGYSGSSFGADLGGFTKTPLGEAAQDVINQAAKFFAKQMENFPFEGSVIKVSDKGQILINRGSEFGVTVGQELVMAEQGEELLDPDTGELLGNEEGEEIGVIRIARVTEKISYADVVSGEANPEPGTTVKLKK